MTRPALDFSLVVVVYPKTVSQFQRSPKRSEGDANETDESSPSLRFYDIRKNPRGSRGFRAGKAEPRIASLECGGPLAAFFLFWPSEFEWARAA